MNGRIFLFLGVFIGIIFLSNLYVWWRLSPLGLGLKWFFILVVAGIGVFLMGAADRLFANEVTRILYIIGMAYWGFLFLLFSTFVVTEPARMFYDPKSVAVAALGLASLFSLIALVLGQSMVTREMSIPVEGLDDEFRVVQFSDVHLGSIRGEKWLAKAVERARAAQPDVVVITGDLFDGSRLVDAETLAPLESLDAPVFVSVGNHEIYDGVDKINNVLAKSKAQLLRNEVVLVDGVQIVGIDHPSAELRRDNPVAATLGIDKEKPAILLYHPPTGAEDAAVAGFDLQLSGHTHDGQIWPFNLLVKPFFPRIAGRYEVNGMTLYTSPGTGTWGPPMRLGPRNEVTVLRLVPVT